MEDYNKMFEFVNSMSLEQRGSYFHAKSLDVLNSLNRLTVDMNESGSIFINYMFVCAAIDGKFHVKEYELLKPLIDMATGKESTYETAVKLYKDIIHADNGGKKAVREMIGLLDKVDPELSWEMITLACILCASDENVSFREKSFIKQLLK